MCIRDRYSIAKGDKRCEKKILFIHTHLVSWTKEFVRTIKSKDISIIHIIRHPMASINSPIKTWLNYQNGSGFFPRELYFQLDLVLNGIFDLMKLKKMEARGFSLGLASHGIGTARAMSRDKNAGVFAAVGMGLSGLITSIIVPLFLKIIF